MRTAQRPNSERPAPAHCRAAVGLEHMMQDFLWLLVAVGLLAATLAYVRLCDNA